MKQTIFRRFTIDKLASVYEEVSNRTFADIRRNKLNNTDFSIISNNCWGGHVYRRYGLLYSSPTIGMYFYSEEYIKLLRNLDRNLFLPFSVVNANESKYYQDLLRKGQKNVFIGKLGNEIELVLLHYHSKEEAEEKWARRLARVNLNNLIVKMSEMNMCSEKHLLEFDEMNYRKKVLFVAKEREKIKSQIIVNRYIRENEISNDTLYYDRYINLNELINALKCEMQ